MSSGLKPARFNDTLQVNVELIKVGAGQIDVVQKVSRDAELIAEAAVKIACVSLSTMRPVRIPTTIRTSLI